MWITSCGKFFFLILFYFLTLLKVMGIPSHLICLLRKLYAGQGATELDMEQQTGSKLGKE